VNADEIRKLAEATLAGSMPFPEIIGHLIAEGVEYYRVDFVARSFAFYGVNGGIVVAPLSLDPLPPVAILWNLAELRTAIRDSQQNGQKFHMFCERAMKSGVQSYFVFLKGKRVTYLGREGDEHIERF
jgi:uncharacterized protein YbcV (DUF1398 family)